MDNQLYLVWMLRHKERFLVGLITEDQKHPFMQLEAKRWHKRPNAIHAHSVLREDNNFGIILSQTGKELERYWFESTEINEHLKE